MATYAIKDWDRVFEDYRSRQVDDLRFITFPLRQDGESFRRLMRSRAGQAAYGVFCAMVQIAARGKKGQRGRLVDDRGPMTPDRIADRLGSSSKHIMEAIELLASPLVGWLVADAESPPSDSDGLASDQRPPSERPANIQDSNTRQQDKTVRQDSKAPPLATAPVGEVIPQELDTPPFREAWTEFDQHRKEIKAPLTDLAAKKILNRLVKIGPDAAVIEINRSIEHQWKGVGPWPDEGKTNGTHPHPSYRKPHASSGSGRPDPGERRAARSRRDFAEPTGGIPILNAKARPQPGAAPPADVPPGESPEAA